MLTIKVWFDDYDKDEEDVFTLSCPTCNYVIGFAIGEVKNICPRCNRYLANYNALLKYRSVREGFFKRGKIYNVTA